MHSVADLILEAVDNSTEAGAGMIKALAEEEEGVWKIDILDDGEWTLEGDPFAEGATTKGKGRGRGLAVIRKASGGRCSLTRGKGYTQLRFMVDDDGSLSDLFHLLLPIFLRNTDVWVSIRSSGVDKTFSTGDLRRENAFPSSASGIKAFRAYIERQRMKEGEIYG